MGLFSKKKEKPQQPGISFHSYSTVNKDGQFMETFGYNCEYENSSTAFFDSLSPEEFEELKNLSFQPKEPTSIDDDHVRLSDWHTDENYYQYNGIVGFVFNDMFSTIISCDTSYEAMLLYRKHLTEQLGFTLENECGITEMTQEYTYQGWEFKLFFYEDESIFFKGQVKNGIMPKCYFDTVSYLREVDVSQYY